MTPIITIALLTGAVLYTAFTGGGDRPFDSGVVLLLVGLGAFTGVGFSRRGTSARTDRLITCLALLVPIYVLFQLVPLPLVIVRLLSPGRAALADATAAFVGQSFAAPLSLSVPTTAIHLVRVCGCAALFLTVRGLTRRLQNPWLAVAPLVSIGLIVAVAAFLAGPSAGGFTAGMYDNRNHFADLLGMLLALTIGGAAVAIQQVAAGGMRALLGTAALLSASGVVFVAALFAWSKGGTLAIGVSLMVMLLLGAVRHLPRRARGWAVATTALAAVVFLVFLTPSGLVERFATATTNDPSEGRLPIWIDTLQLIRAYPLVGVGLGNFYPALLPFQTYGLQFAWIAAHNDYLQFLAELGIVGGVLLGSLVLIVFARSARAAETEAVADLRMLALALAGGMTVFLVHSTSEFNSYVLSNALVFAWLAGVAAALPSRSAAWPAPRTSGAQGFAVTAAVLMLAGVTTAGGAGWMAFTRWAPRDAATERRFCRVGICDSEMALNELRRDPDPTLARPVPVPALLEYLRRDPAAPNRWEDVGEALQREGRTVEARAAFDQALRLAPRSPGTLLMAADFHFDVGETAAALPLVARSLEAGEDGDRAAFAVLDYRKVPPQARLALLPDARAAASYVRWLIENGRVAELPDAWECVVGRGAATDALARQYVDLLVGQHQPSAAARGWGTYAANRFDGYPQRERVFNSGFEAEPSGVRFDWRINRVAGVAVDFDEAVHHAGRRALRARFDGTTNVGDLAVEQAVFLAAGNYKLRAFVRTDAVTTNEGIRFAVFADLVPTALNLKTSDLRGTNDWTEVTESFAVPEGGALVRIALTRVPSLKFDSLVAGTAWVDDVSVEAVG